MSQVITTEVAASRTQIPRSAAKTLFLLTAIVLLAVGAALRFYHLGERSLWFDEAVTANASRGTFLYVLEKTRHFSAPVVHPYLLYFAEHTQPGPIAARIPSAIASFLVIIVMLAMVRTGAGYSASLFAAAILTFSASQVRYAQEVREYSLAVLVAALLVYSFLRQQAVEQPDRQPWFLYCLFFLAPLVQYGLVFFSAGVLGAIVLLLVFRRASGFTLRHAVLAAGFLAAGVLPSFFLTLRYQFHAGSTPWYLAESYFDPRKQSLLQFVQVNARALLSFLIPGRVIDLCIVLAVLIFSAYQLFKRNLHPVLLLAVTTLSIHIAVSIVRIYPFGGVRQCLFLAPPLALLAGVALAQLTRMLQGSARAAAAAAILAVIVFSLWRGMLSQWPYQEYEDTKAIMWQLTRSLSPGDQVWVHHDAADAFQFYERQVDRRFTYGVYHPDVQDYLPELQAAIAPSTQRVWLVFSHQQQPSDRAEEQWIVHSLRPSWDVRTVMTPMNTELLVANRKHP
jgi:uncharacterized membrane protein